jgi:outer membrane protein insertion porin family
MKVGMKLFLLSFDTRDNVLDPSRGVFAQLGVELAGGAMGGQSDFSKLTAKLANFFPLSKKLVFGIGITGGYAWTYKDEEVPIQERFYAGGLNSVRGYKEDSLGPKDEDGVPLGGEELLVGSIELRRNLYRRLKGVLFYDIGNVWSTKDKETETNDKIETSMRASAGIGFRLITPVGPIRVDYGWILDRRPEEAVGKFYLSVGHTF